MIKPKKLVLCVGLNDADYVTKVWETIRCVKGKLKKKRVWECPYHRAWYNMINRCYSEKHQKKHKKKHTTYIGCTVSEDWLTFSVFKSWMEKQDFEGKHLDKDLLFEGNKVYSEKTCVFVSQSVNNFTLDRRNDRGEWPIGVCWHKRECVFTSRCSNPFTKKREHLGYFDCPNKAHKAWLKRKLELAHLIADEQTDERVAKALIERYTNYEAST